MSQKKLPTLVATRPVLLRETVYTEGEPYIARSAEEAAELEREPSWRRATKKDLEAWATRLSRDPAIAYLRERPPVTETEYDAHPEEAAKAKAEAEEKARAEAQAKAAAEAQQKLADEVRASAAGKAEGGSQPGPSGGARGPGGIG